jgi:N-acetylglucosamine malate deacetylase 1
MREPRENYTLPEKVAILRRHLIDRVPVSDLRDAYQLQPTLFYAWQKQFFANCAAAFERKNAVSGVDHFRVIAALHDKIQRKYEVVVELTRCRVIVASRIATMFMVPIDRREIITWACSFAGLARANPLDASPRKRKVIVTGGHPGDPEYGCGGTIARFADLGDEVVLLYLNEGVPDGKPRDGVRVAEARKACAILQARPIFAGQVDGAAVVDRGHYESFRKLIESEQPDVVFTHWPIDNHADHRALSMLVYDAWLRMGKKFALYYYEVSNGEDTVQFSPTHYVDITDVMPRKRQACFAHASQAPEKFVALQEQVTRMRGIERGCRHAEGFIRHIQSPDFVLPPGK